MTLANVATCLVLTVSVIARRMAGRNALDR